MGAQHRAFMKSTLAKKTFQALLSEFKEKKAKPVAQPAQEPHQALCGAYPEGPPQAAHEAPPRHMGPAPPSMQLNRVHNGHSAPPGAVQHQQHAPPPHHGVSFLHYEISLLAQRATEAAIKDVALVAWATAAVQQAAMTLWPAAEVFVYGSRSTGLSLPQSDLDIMIVMPTPESGPQMLSRDAAKDYVRMLYSGLAGQLNRTAWAKNVEAITNATMPVIHLFAQKPGAEASLSHSNTGSHELPLDISIVTGRHQGEKGIVLMQQLQAALPQLRPLFLAIKTLLLSHGLCCTYRGGLSSYGLVLLVSYFLQVTVWRA